MSIVVNRQPCLRLADDVLLDVSCIVLCCFDSYSMAPTPRNVNNCVITSCHTRSSILFDQKVPRSGAKVISTLLFIRVYTINNPLIPQRHMHQTCHHFQHCLPLHRSKPTHLIDHMITIIEVVVVSEHSRVVSNMKIQSSSDRVLQIVFFPFNTSST